MMSLLALIAMAYGISRSNADMMTGYGDNLFGHKCSYLWRFPNQSSQKNDLMKISANGKTCSAVQLNYIGRHGARFPGTDDLHYFEELRDRILNNSVPTKYTDFLRNWKDYLPKNHGHLEDIGHIEMNMLGEMYGKSLYNLFHGHVSSNTIKLEGSNKKRTRTSAKDFYKGLTKFVTGTGLEDITPSENDATLKFYENCPNYDVSVMNNLTNNYEVNAFINGSYFQGVTRNVTSRLGMKTTLGFWDMLKIFLLCATDLAVRNDTRWCNLLTKEDIEILNYENDLWDYYNLMYGHPLIQKITCPLWEDVFSSFDNAIKMNDANQTYLLGDLRFGHSHSLDPFYASIGLFRDSEPIRAKNYLTTKNRIFFESKVTPFGAHVAFILYNCGGRGPQNYVLKMMVNGMPMAIPACGSDTCPYLTVKAKYRDLIENCHWQELCHISKPAIG